MSERGYGSHPTIYGNLTDGQLYQMYRSEIWKGLNEDNRQQLLQETVNRSALEHGEIGACKVVFSHDLDVGTDGQQSGNMILMDYEKFVNDREVRIYNEKEIYHDVIDSNMQALTTAFHEDEHAYQNQVIEGLIPGDAKETIKEYKANDFTLAVIKQDNSIHIGSQYLNGISNYYLYYLQSTERDAFRNSEDKAVKVMEYLKEQYGEEKSFEVYRAGLQAKGFEAVLKEAQQYFQNENIEKDINQTLMNQYYATNEPVDSVAKSAVKREMILSYQHQMRNSMKNDSEKDVEILIGKTDGNTKMSPEGENMDFKNLRVTKEEYAQSLRDTVNKYYEHALNDPNMSRKEVIEETGKMAEDYLNAVDEFPDDNLEAGTNPDIAEAINAVENGEGEETDMNLDVAEAISVTDNDAGIGNESDGIEGDSGGVEDGNGGIGGDE